MLAFGNINVSELLSGKATLLHTGGKKLNKRGIYTVALSKIKNNNNLRLPAGSTLFSPHIKYISYPQNNTVRKVPDKQHFVYMNLIKSRLILGNISQIPFSYFSYNPPA